MRYYDKYASATTALKFAMNHTVHVRVIPASVNRTFPISNPELCPYPIYPIGLAPDVNSYEYIAHSIALNPVDENVVIVGGGGNSYNLETNANPLNRDAWAMRLSSTGAFEWMSVVAGRFTLYQLDIMTGVSISGLFVYCVMYVNE